MRLQHACYTVLKAEDTRFAIFLKIKYSFERRDLAVGAQPPAIRCRTCSRFAYKVEIRFKKGSQQ